MSAASSSGARVPEKYRPWADMSSRALRLTAADAGASGSSRGKRFMKNSSMLELTMPTNLSRSSRGLAGSMPSARTRAWNSSRDSSRSKKPSAGAGLTRTSA